ncbi:unnamed protein product [Cyclocybe aegerita]|uniref:Uncharacterized protein n=1 Tax=Cyclocybe aegerita TaxID=1973307 RepID=A0A8S0X405_CYCAE|nr:unnamed protein product [Cyclocybe aegerita]
MSFARPYTKLQRNQREPWGMLQHTISLMAEYFDPGFKGSLENVNGDVSTRWPIFRDEKRPQEVICDVITKKIAEMDGPDDLPYCLDLYSMCLGYICQYDPKGKLKINRACVRRALEIHAPAILKEVWEGFFFMFPFFPDDLDPQMISSATNFVTKLFDLYKSWEDAQEGPCTWLWVLPFLQESVSLFPSRRDRRPLFLFRR